jgi:phosphate transport system permease protein
VAALAVYLVAGGAGALRQIPLGELASSTWLPLDERFGMLPLALGTLATTVLALAVAIPVGLAAALFLTLHAGPRLRAFADSAVALLGGLPSVVIGLWGLTWIVPLAGNSLASASLVLALAIVPTFTLLSGAALRQVPADLVEAVRALGVGDDVAAVVLLRHARWGVFAAATLAATRGLGEAVAVSMVAGNVGYLPSSLSRPVATLTTTLIVEFDGSTGLHRGALHLAALAVMALIAAVSLAGRAMQRKEAAA